ncbi:MAG: histidinol dehydrogenase [Nitrososphaeria archaeon]
MRVFELEACNFKEVIRTIQSYVRVSDKLERSVQNILRDVRKRGDFALFKYTRSFDKFELTENNIRVSKKEIQEAYDKVSRGDLKAFKTLKNNIERVEVKTLCRLKINYTFNGIRVSQEIRPLDSVGCYVPGGKASYPSTLLMTVVPAKVAKVRRVVVVSPPKKITPELLVAADIAGVDEVYRVGGAQAIAALAYGTKSILPVQKIVGPGNLYVTIAKKVVSKDVEIDMLAGPTEILIFADESADPREIALDLISQAEHGPDSVCGVVTQSKALANNIIKEVIQFCKSVERGDFVLNTMEDNAFVVVTKGIEDTLSLINDFAPEHLEVLSREPEKIVTNVSNAGVIVVNTPSVITDYYSGVNHVLPTSCNAKIRGGLTILDYMKVIRIVSASKQGMAKSFPTIRRLALLEGLPNHLKSVEYRVKTNVA